ncbi:hypothetical protein GCM10023322_06190 [Rugosimonospora acidiphila]|uniref:ABC transporter substrate-binding protein n=1 Tax=Rugosimonospora acidiphila TaxID=556531 RepID=A0ABP9RK96_9ACTN
MAVAIAATTSARALAGQVRISLVLTPPALVGSVRLGTPGVIDLMNGEYSAMRAAGDRVNP